MALVLWRISLTGVARAPLLHSCFHASYFGMNGFAVFFMGFGFWIFDGLGLFAHYSLDCVNNGCCYYYHNKNS